MKYEIKYSRKPLDYRVAIDYLDRRMQHVDIGSKKELIWFLEHNAIFTGGTSYTLKDVKDKSVEIIKTKRGGKITWHGPGQLICYLVINLRKRKKDLRKFIMCLENAIIDTLKIYNIKSYSDRKNIGIWIKKKNKKFKIAAIGLRVRKWIVYHGFSININNLLTEYDKINPCGLNAKNIINLRSIKNIDYKDIKKQLEKNLIKNFKY
ncbi:MAG: lipoyl(octanoyl) transferase [Candidatus Pelagibacter sp. TMED273]|nr:MAG: lipoyl(octanoyl) transferase [Candidatus Pelagibacter sp. TMED273]|tara:strand:- start:1490 stop:2110 length:621 start_codon:yes stop_codon:yes gene_type:complete